MKRILRFLLIAATALPMWQPTVAQDFVLGQAPLEVPQLERNEIGSTLRDIATIVENKDVQKQNVVKQEKDLSLRSHTESFEKTVCEGDGTTIHNCVPIHGYWIEKNGTYGQMIYPAENLGLQKGDVINKITFYGDRAFIRSNGNGALNSNVTLRLGRTTETTITSSTVSTNRSGATAVYTGTVPTSASDYSVTFNFTNNYTYNGDNLIVDLYSSGGDYYTNSNHAWYGVNSGSSYYYNTQTSTAVTFLPKMTIYYTREVTDPYEATIEGNDALGQVVVNQTGRSTFVVTNTGANPFTPVVTISGDQAFTVKTTAHGELAPGGTRYYVVTFAPKALQSYSATLNLTAQESEAATAINTSVTLSGAGVESLQQQLADGTNQGAVPVYLQGLSRLNHGQTIYKSSTLNLPKGAKIKKITFHANRNLSASTNNNGGSSKPVTLKIGETTNSSYPTSSISSSDFISVAGASATVDNILNNKTEVSFEFVEPYEYKGGNLVVDVESAAGGDQTASTVTWLGQSSSGSSILRYGSNYYAISHLPKITIDWVPKEIEARDIVVKDSLFFKGKTYTWVEDGVTKEANLNEVATTPKQMIAMLTKVYTDKTIPGNLKRGFDEYGNDEAWNDCHYTGVGTIINDDASSVTSLKDENAYHFDKSSRGWDIPGDIAVKNITYTNSNYHQEYAYYAFMDSTQYRPNEEGLTLILVELKDDFKKSDLDNVDWSDLETYFAKTLKSARVIPEARRTGKGLDAGTLFKIDCDKMNKFFLLAKGQLCWKNNSFYATYVDHTQSDGSPDYLLKDFCGVPAYIFYENYYYNNYDYYTNGFYDYYSQPLFYHMFEEFSPVSFGEDAQDDIYQDLVNMESFGVIHDCASVAPIQEHQFMMYGENSVNAADCQDVRDMMFFIPDYRMMKDETRDNDVYGCYKFSYYNRAFQPIMGLYVIRQAPVTETVPYTDDYYHLTLTWDTNLDEFMPNYDQEFDLMELVYNEETERDEYVPVYYTKIAIDGKTVVYYDPTTGSEGDNYKTPIKLKFNAGENKLYTDVYVQRDEASKQVTYAIQGWDAADAQNKHFLSLQISNQESYIIKGTDPSEIVSLVELSHYSRFNVHKMTNCYSNRFKLLNNIDGLNVANIVVGGTNPTGLSFVRKSADGDVEIAKATFPDLNNKVLSVEMKSQSSESDFPVGLNTGSETGKHAGYHANNGGEVIVNQSGNETWTMTYDVDDKGYIRFKDESPLVICDNFTADVANGEQPPRYTYEVYTTNIKHVEGDAFTGEGHGNLFNVTIYKTKTSINSYTLAQVDADTNGDMKLEDANFDVDLQKSSKTEILRYDAYRWVDGANDWGYIIKTVNGVDDEVDLPPTGEADNEAEYYTVRMNSETGYETNSQVSVANETGTGTATFEDKVPRNSSAAAVYTYAPVIDTFTTGKDVNGNKRRDYNTYGGPLQSTAVGKLELEVVEPTIIENGEAVPQVMSEYSWEANGNEYAYYNLYLKLKRMAGTTEVPVVPSGYEFYKLRAWRQILQKDENDNLVPAPGLLGEEDKYTNPESEFYNNYFITRMGNNAKFKLEEFTYPDCKADMSASVAMNNLAEFGSEEVVIDDATVVDMNNVPVTKGYFGALKASDDVEFTVRFIVRVYFAPTSVVAVANDLNNAKGTPQEELKGFYVVEAVKDYKIDSDVPTAINTIFDTNREVVGVKYYNVAGIESSTPFQGVNIVVTRYSDGSTTTTKILK